MMTERSTHHATFVIDRSYEASPAQLFKAWADPVAKAQWFQKAEVFDFRIGGRESSHGGPPQGPVYAFDACYQEIVPDQRIVYSYVMDQDSTRISVSVVTVEFKTAGDGTRLIYTEQGAFLDGHDTPAQREHGTKELLDKLGEALKQA